MNAAARVMAVWRRLSSRPPETEILVAALGFGLATLALLGLLGEMGEGETERADRMILLALRAPGDPSDPIGPAWLESACRDLTSLGSPAVLFLVTLAVVGGFLVRGRRASALFVVAAVGGAGLLSLALKAGFARPRPDLVSHLVTEHSFSFPSGHATMATATYLTLGALLAREQARPAMKLYVVAAGLAVAGLVGLTRIFLGVHWPTDVIAGWCVGAAWALGSWGVAAALQRRSET